MAARIHHFRISVDPTGVGYQVDRTDFPPGVVSAFVIGFPSGHRNVTGINISYGDVKVIPRSDALYLREPAGRHRFDLDDPFPGGVGWFVQTVNTGRYTHTFEVTVELDELVADGALPGVLLLPYTGETPYGELFT